MKVKFFFCLLFFILFVIYTSSQKKFIKKPDREKKIKKVAVIFIHGTTNLTFKKIFKMILFRMLKKRKKSLLEIRQEREERFRKAIEDHRGISSNIQGLVKISKETLSKISYEEVFKPFKRDFENIPRPLSTTYLYDYYTFNWSGILDPEERTRASQELYRKIEKLKKDNEREIILVGYSHGGNVALELGNIAKKNNQSKTVVDILFLLGTPFKKNNTPPNNTYFNFIFNLYSTKDWYQISDVFYSFPKTQRKLSPEKNIFNIEVEYHIFNKEDIRKKHFSPKKIYKPTHRNLAIFQDGSFIIPTISSLGKIIRSIIHRFNTAKHYQKLKLFVEKEKKNIYFCAFQPQ
jgi:hypothetical protein